MDILGSNTTITWENRKQGQKVARKVLTIYVHMGLQTIPLQIKLTKLLFISDYLVGRGSTVWKCKLPAGHLKQPATYVAVKDSWIDPLRKFTEGAILRILNKAGIEGIPTLIYDRQVMTKVDNKNGGQTMANQSTHCVRATLQRYPSSQGTYQLQVLYRLVTESVGSLVTDFWSLGELLVSFLDFVVGEHLLISVSRAFRLTPHCSAHKDALERTGILHHDISLVNLLLAFSKSKWSNHRMFMDHLSLVSWHALCTRIESMQ
ncbi:hypothetical protein JVT61DRAFT_12217 [Boletus reticuloceps]|uniref:Fungal-type protein kinase domain-containing protein n=1 Tax=Boletus reticuloceps TaxID=495285 RepID=A0A8I2YE52_9AGAM|nr:hypothetical protein JVT61DRAFT_12217 [Boletus reticuloceps]